MNPELRTIKFPGLEDVYSVKKSNVHYFDNKEDFRNLIDSGNGNIGDIAIFSENIYENEVSEVVIFHEIDGWIPLISGVSTDLVIYKNGKTLTEILDETLFKEDDEEIEIKENTYVIPTFFVNGKEVKNNSEILIGNNTEFTYTYETNLEEENIDHEIFNLFYNGLQYNAANNKIVENIQSENKEIQLNFALSLDAENDNQVFPKEDEFIITTQLPTFIQLVDIKNGKLLNFGENHFEVKLNSENNKLSIAIPYSINIDNISVHLNTNGFEYNITKLIETEQKYLEFGFGEKRYNVYSYTPDAIYENDIYKITIERGTR